MLSATTIVAAASLAGTSMAFPAFAHMAKRQDANPWQAPVDGDLRSPCPGTNTLANHGFINRNGQGVTKQEYQQGFLDAFHMSFEATDPGTTNAINLCSQITGTTCTSFNLDQLSTPHAIEHDASLTRLDANMTDNQNADNHDFNQGVWDQTKALFGNADHITVDLANTAREGRINQAKAADTPGWFVENSGGSTTEHAFYLTTMDDPALNPPVGNPDPHARLDWMDHWFVNQELPTALGWVRPAATIGSPYLNQIIQSVSDAPTAAPSKRAASPEPVPVVNVVDLLNGAPKSAVATALPVAQAKAGPAPNLANAYTETLSSDEWGSQIDGVSSYVSKVQDALANIIG